MNTEVKWRPENVEENVEMINSAKGGTGSPAENTATERGVVVLDEERHQAQDKLPSNSNSKAPPPPLGISRKKQRQLGPAPIASFEDTSDEVRIKVCIDI